MSALLLAVLALPASEPYPLPAAESHALPQSVEAWPAAAAPGPGCSCCGTGQGDCCQQPCACEGHCGWVRAWLHGLFHQQSCACCPAADTVGDAPAEGYSHAGGVTWTPSPYHGATGTPSAYQGATGTPSPYQGAGAPAVRESVSPVAPPASGQEGAPLPLPQGP
jgi:hypothetical protein